jgi:DNA-binding beta-propeller fold protein YncE
VLVAAGRAFLVLDAEAVSAGTQDPVAVLEPTGADESVGIALTPDDRLAFVTDEDRARVSVFDLGGSLGEGRPAASLVAHVPIAAGATGIAVSADGAHVFATSQNPGTLSVLHVERAAEGDPGAVVATVAAGSQPVRVAVAPPGDTVWVTDRGGDRLLAFDLERLLGGGDPLAASVAVGKAPVGVAVAGGLVVVANSNRYRGGDRPQTLSVVDAAAALGRGKAVLGTIAAGAFPRDVVAHPDGCTVLVTNFRSRTLETVSLAAL